MLVSQDNVTNGWFLRVLHMLTDVVKEAAA